MSLTEDFINNQKVKINCNMYLMEIKVFHWRIQYETSTGDSNWRLQVETSNGDFVLIII